MIWFFLMGMIAGAVGMIMLACAWVRTHSRKVTYEEAKDELDKMKQEESDD